MRALQNKSPSFSSVLWGVHSAFSRHPVRDMAAYSGKSPIFGIFGTKLSLGEVQETDLTAALSLVHGGRCTLGSVPNLTCLTLGSVLG